jgi:hypothetical protein
MRIIGLLALLLLFTANPVAAAPKRGEVSGTIVDRSSQEGVGGVTIVFESPALKSEEVVIGNDDGTFTTSLPAGTYKVTMIFGDLRPERTVVVKEGKTTTLREVIDTQKAGLDDGRVLTSPVEKPYTVSGDGFSLVQAKDHTVTLTEKGKPPVTYSVRLRTVRTGDTIVADFTQHGKEFRISVKGKRVATLEDGGLKLPDRPRLIVVGNDGVLANAKQKLTITPASASRDPYTMIAIAALLHQRL